MADSKEVKFTVVDQGAAGSKWLDNRNHERFTRTPGWFKAIINGNIKSS